MTFFTKDYIDFLCELEANNEREWFKANKKRYENSVKKPFEAFVANMIGRFQAINPSIMLTPKEAIFRIYRDVRFSKDKSPYKLHMSAVIAPGGRKGKLSPGAYLELSGQSAKIYGGVYMPDKQTLQKIREKLAANPQQFEELLRDKDFVEKFGGIHGEKNKRLPKEFAEAAEKQPLIFNKSFYFFHEFEPEIILQENFPDMLVQYFIAGRPMSEFLSEV